MKKWISFIVLTYSATLWSNTQNIVEENYYQHFRQVIQEREASKQGNLFGFTAFEQGLFVDALWDMLDEGSKEAEDTLSDLQVLHYTTLEKLRLGLLKIRYKKSQQLDAALVEELINTLRAPEADTKLVYTIAAYEEELRGAGHDEIVELAALHPQFYDIKDDEERKKDLTRNVVGDLFYQTPDTTTYMNGEYARSVKIFMFCRTNRLFPCLMVMKDALGEVVRNPDGTIWTHKALASSSRGLPSYTRNGNTPAGIFTIDSVMPHADQQISFGKFRRMILNFIPKSKNESLIKSLLPRSSWNEEWWKPTLTARDIGRNLFRIHGTGKLNNDPETPYYPFMRTSGCIAQRENTYGDVTYKDQRELLDAVMVALSLTPNFANEVKVKGILYLMELDDQAEPVTEDDLVQWGIE